MASLGRDADGNRVGVVFAVQCKIEDILAWRNPIETVAGMLIFSLVTIDPYLLIPLPLFILMFALLIPSYQVRHPPPPLTDSNIPTEVTQATSPPPQPAKPAPELSRDFFMNMRDIQNVMDDFSSVFDLVRGWILHATTFKNEPLSSTILAFSALAAVGMVLFVQYLPVRWFILVLGNAAILSCHPMLYRHITTTIITPEKVEKWKEGVETFAREDYIPPLPSKDVTYTVEIFESRRLLPPIPPNHLPDWSPSQYSPFPPQLTSGTNKISVVSPPPGFKFTEMDWRVDEDKRWAREREIDDDSGFWSVEEDELDREGEGWVVYEAGGWKVRRMTRYVVRHVEKV
jgi:Integral peroxisomal membrane peroxin